MREPQKVEAVSACRSCGKPIERRGQLWYVTGGGPASDICVKERSGCHKPVGKGQPVGHALRPSAPLGPRRPIYIIALSTTTYAGSPLATVTKNPNMAGSFRDRDEAERAARSLGGTAVDFETADADWRARGKPF